MTLASSSITLANVNDGAPGKTGATGNGIRSVTVSYGVSASASTQPTSWSPTIPTVAENQFLWTRTITDYTDDAVADTVTYTYALQGKTGKTGASAKDFTLYQSSTFFEVSPRGVTHKMQVISITCVPLNLASPSISWSVSSAVPTKAISSDKTVLSLTVQSGVALADLTVTCSVSGIGTKTIKIVATPVGDDGPLYLGTDWDETAATTGDGDPLRQGDYYLRLSDTMVRIYGASGWQDVSAATSTHKMMQDALSDVLKTGTDVKQSSSVLYAYVGNLVAQSASIRSLSTEVITSANYAEDANGLPVAGYKFDGPRDLLSSVGMKATGGVFKDISIVGGTATMMTPDNTTVFQTNTTESLGTISVTIPSGNKIYSIKSVVDSMTTKPDTSMPATGALGVDSAVVNGTSYNGILHVAKGGNVSPYLDHVIQVNPDTGAIVTQDFPVSPLSSDSIVRDFDGNYGIKQIVVNVYGISEISCYKPALVFPNTNLTISIYSPDGSLLASKTKESGGSYLVISYGSVIPVGSKVVSSVKVTKSGSLTYFTTWHFRTHFPLIKPVHGDDLLFFNSEPSSAANFYVHLSTYSDVPFSISRVKNTNVSVSTSSFLTAMPVADMISTMPNGSFVATDDTSSIYSSASQTQITLKQLIVNDSSIVMIPVTGTNIVLGTGDVVDNPALTFVSISAKEGISVLNVNALSSSSQIGTSYRPFAYVYVGNVDLSHNLYCGMILWHLCSKDSEGTVIPPTGFLLLDNSFSISRSGSYAALFALIEQAGAVGEGKVFHYGSDNNTIVAPDVEGRYLRIGNNGDSGNLIAAGLPDIVGSLRFFGHGDGLVESATGAFAKTGYYESGDGYKHANTGGHRTVEMKASRSNVIYGRSTSVTPSTIPLHLIIGY